MTDARRAGAARHGAVYSSLGVRIRIRCDDGEIARGLDDLYAACRRPNGETPDIDLDLASCEPNGFDIRADDELLYREIPRHEILAWCTWLINNLASERTPHLALHAAAAARDGRGVILTGPSGSGKSTLVTALVVAGWSYLTDDSLAVDRQGPRIRSNPKPIALDTGSCRALSLDAPRHRAAQAGKALIAPRSLGMVLDSESRCTPALIVRPLYRPGSGTAVAPLAPAEAAQLLADQAFNFDSDGTTGLRAVAAIARSCTALIVEYDEPDGAVAAISSALATHGSSGAPSRRGPVPAVVPSRPDLDVEILGDEALIWHRRERELHRLSPAATAIWLSAQGSLDAITITELLGAVGRASSPAERRNALDGAEACIDELRLRGLLDA